MRRAYLKRLSKHLLSGTGQRLTNQRALLLELIREGQTHLDADELYRIAKIKQPRISLSTVYRSLQLFKRIGLVDECHFDETHHHYEVRSSQEHMHLFCLDCGQVSEYIQPLGEDIKEKISREKEFEINSLEIRILGYCGRCREKRKKKAKT